MTLLLFCIYFNLEYEFEIFHKFAESVLKYLYFRISCLINVYNISNAQYCLNNSIMRSEHINSWILNTFIKC